MIKILFICHGNICRSTMAQSVLTWSVRQGLKTALRLILRRPAVRRSATRRTTAQKINYTKKTFRLFRTGRAR